MHKQAFTPLHSVYEITFLLMFHKLKQCNMWKSILSRSHNIIPMGPLSHVQLLVRSTAPIAKGWLLCRAVL